MKTNIMSFHTYDVTKPFSDREQGVENIQVFKNFYWLCVDGDPTKALFYGNYYAPQCNQNKSILEHRYAKGTQAERIGNLIEAEVKIVQIPLAYSPGKYM